MEDILARQSGLYCSLWTDGKSSVTHRSSCPGAKKLHFSELRLSRSLADPSGGTHSGDSVVRVLAAQQRLWSRLSSWCGIFIFIKWSDSPWFSGFISQMKLCSRVWHAEQEKRWKQSEVLTEELCATKRCHHSRKVTQNMKKLMTEELNLNCTLEVKHHR